MARWLCCAQFLCAVLFVMEPSPGGEQEPVPVTLDNVVDPGANDSTEALAAEFSLARSVRFLDSAALTWQKDRKCFTCHTNYAFLYARPLVSADGAAHDSVRQFAEELVAQRWKDQGPRWDAEVVATAAALAFNDAHTTGELHPLTRQALDRMWALQREDGGWNWIKCDWPPMESDDDYGVSVAALAVGVAPGGYAETEAARKGMERLRQYLTDHPPTTLHHRAMLLWGASYIPDLMTAEQKQSCMVELLALQKADGGWALATLGDWQRADKSPQDMETSDGYGTGFVIYVLRRAGLPADDARLQRGVAWLKAHQRESGRWFTRSLHKDSKHFITHAATAFAVMALAACEEGAGTK
jgi:squalene-hopene/tetraprenyl-beta-curcumene cyclase